MPQFTSANAVEAAAKSRATSTKREALKQAVALQNLCFRAANDISPDVSGGKFSREAALALTGVVRAWDTAVDRWRVLKGIPMPGSCKPLPKTLRAKPKNRFLGITSEIATLHSPPGLPSSKPARG